MDLVYFYPFTDGAPSTVARNLFDSLLNKKEDLPFENIYLYAGRKFNKSLIDKYDNIKVLSTYDLLKIKNCLIHIPVSPLVFPNSKFLLNLIGYFRGNRLLLNFHGDLVKEVSLRFNNDHKIEFSKIPTCILFPIFLSKSDCVVVNSYMLANKFESKYGAKNVKVIPNALDKFWFSTHHVNKEDFGNCIKLFYHGRLSPEKGVDLLLKGFSSFLSSHPSDRNMVLFIAGDGPQMNSLQLLCMELNISDNVIFLGNLSKNEIVSYLISVHAAVYPSIWDAFALSYLEAFACANCPVYFSNKAGIYDFTIHDGYSLNSFNPNINNIQMLISTIVLNQNKSNNSIVRNQKQFAKNYSWDLVAKKYVDIYNDLSNLND